MKSKNKHLIPACMVALFLGCNRGQPENHSTGEDFNPVYPDMLIGCEYTGRTGGSQYDDLKWTFDEKSFEIVAGANGMPSDLVETLLPPNTTANHIAGSWSVEGEELTLSDISADEMPLDQSPITLRTMCTPVIRIQPQSAQYMFRRGTAAGN